MLDDTIIAVSSAPGPGLRAIVRLSGPNAIDIAASKFVPFDPAKRLMPGRWSLDGLATPLPVDLYAFRAPHTYTGEPLAELHTIGSPPLVERLVAELLSAGARSARPGEFTMRAFLAGKKDLTQAEAVLAVIEATSDAELQQALEQLAGGISQPLHVLREDLLDLLAEIEAALDFTDEDIEFVTQRDTILRIARAMAHIANLKRQLDGRSTSDRRPRVVLAGEPNAGKSSLFNALIGRDAAIVSDVAGTTRDYISARLDLGDIEIELIDTAGWEAASEQIGAQAQALGRERAAEADIVLRCIPATDSNSPAMGPKEFAVRTKADLAPAEGLAVAIGNPDSIAALRKFIRDKALSLAVSPLAPSLARCRHHVDAALACLRSAHRHAIESDPPELLALSLRGALDEIGTMAGTVHSNDLLDRIFGRFCIGK